MLFDTSIVLDALVEGRPQSAEAWRALERCNGEGDIGFVMPMSLKDVYYVLSKAGGERRARESVRQLMELLTVVPLGSEECGLSVESNEPDFEDGLVRASAELNDIDFILTRDVKAYKKSKVRSVTCAEYLSIAEGAS